MNGDFGNQLVAPINNMVNQVIDFIPEFLAGLILLGIGWAIATAVSTLVRKALEGINFGRWTGAIGMRESTYKSVWVNLISQVVFWWIIILFLIPALEAWRLVSAVTFLNQLLAYLPNVLAAIIIGIVALVLARLASQAVYEATRPSLGNKAGLLSSITRYSILAFAVLIILLQLGIAPSLINILFSALTFGLALAVGLAVGLGGRTTVERMLNQMTGRSGMEKPDQS